MPATEATLTMAPWRRCAIRTPTLRATMKVPRRSILTSRSHCSMRTFSSLCILPKTPAALTSPVIGPCVASMSAMPLTTALSLATSNGAGHRIVCVPASGSGAISTITIFWPCSASSVALAAPMPRLPPVTRTIPSAVMTIAFFRCEQAARNQLSVGGDDMLGRCRDAAANVGVAAAQISTRAHQYVNDGLELIVAIIDDRAGLAGAPEDADIGGGDVIEMLLVADRREIFGLVEDAQKFRHLADEIEERAEAFDFLPRRLRGPGALADEVNHVGADLRQQLVEQFLAIFKVIVERSLRDTGLLGNARN